MATSQSTTIRPMETRARVKNVSLPAVSRLSRVGRFHARSRFARFTFPEGKWGTHRCLTSQVLGIMLVAPLQHAKHSAWVTSTRYQMTEWKRVRTTMRMNLHSLADWKNREEMARGVRVREVTRQTIFKLIWLRCILYVEWPHKDKGEVITGQTLTNFSFLWMKTATTSTRKMATAQRWESNSESSIWNKSEEVWIVTVSSPHPPTGSKARETTRWGGGGGEVGRRDGWNFRLKVRG